MYPELSIIGEYSKLKSNMLKIVIIPSTVKKTKDKENAETTTGTIISIENGLLIPPEKKSNREIWARSKARNKNVLKADNLFSVLK